jgi:hypothetical protein
MLWSGALYTRADRYTKACRHYQQGIELFRSTSDGRNAAAMAIAFGRALRARLGTAAPAGARRRLPLLFRYASADGAAAAAAREAPAAIATEMVESELGDYERCTGAFELAKELAGGGGGADSGGGGGAGGGGGGAAAGGGGGSGDPLWREAELEHGRTLAMQAARLSIRASRPVSHCDRAWRDVCPGPLQVARLEDSLPFAPDSASAAGMARHVTRTTPCVSHRAPCV